MTGFMLSKNYSVSSLFSGMISSNTQNSGSSIYSSLSELSNIRSGSYYKLLNKYYSGDSSSDTKSTVSKITGNISTSKADTKSLTALRSSTDTLKNAVSTLRDKTSDSVFTRKDGEYDVDKIYSAVSSFVDAYNGVLDKADSVDSSSVSSSVNSMINNSQANSRTLSSIGISIANDGSLKLDKDTFMKADMSKVESLFNPVGSYGYQVGTSASMIDYAAQNEASKSNTYTSYGNYSYNYSAGSLYNFGL